MKTRILVLFTRTPLHVGAGSSVGAVDQPVIRERHTGFPVIPGSAVKGVLRDYADRDAEGLNQEVETLFGLEGSTGNENNTARAGALGFGEARLLAFPLRSAKGSFALATCPLALSRYVRDGELPLDVPNIGDEGCLAGDSIKLGGNKVALEEYVFAAKGGFPGEWAGHLSTLLDDAVLREAKDRMVLLSDGDFSHFTLNACQVQHHNRIDPDTGTVVDKALFNTETVPSEALFYAPITALRPERGDNALFRHLEEKERLLQFGGDGTTGLGFCAVRLAKEDEPS
ncbi:MAG: type III-B CRISPR module RAMP protein Cmr4 [Planctomycetota bacterium]|jgi:CRISPR-associated protein Cmr4|nr:type III-B CRISPR module RAMP protein Cmr4 [Planctomycetota bacterium]